MWGNKVDNAMIYHRPKFNENKNSREIQIRQVKTKRKRTGGENGEYDLVMLWESKRFCDPLTNEVPCNPQIASVMVYKENNDYRQTDLGLEDQVPF